MRKEGEGAAPGGNLTEKVKPDPYADLTPDQRYVAELKELGRVRLAARADIGGRVRGWLEWIDDSGESVEYIEVAAVEALNRPGFRRHLAAINYGLGGGGYEHETLYG